MLQQPGKVIIADAGANDLIQVNANGSITTLAIFTDRLEDAPGFPGSATGNRDTDGWRADQLKHYYVGQLTGFPFPTGGAKCLPRGPCL